MGDHKHHDDHHHDAHHGGHADAGEPLPPLRLQAGSTPKGHEIDLTPDRNLFAFLGAMTVILVIVGIGVWQLFLMHSDNVLAAAAAKPSPLVVAQQEKDSKFFETYGKATPEEGVETIRVPVSAARALVLADPSRFKAWPSPDAAPAPSQDGAAPAQGGAAPAMPAPADGAAPPPGGAAPAPTAPEAPKPEIITP